MPAPVYLPRAQETSLGRLGDVLLGSAADYADKRRADEREARLRAQRLEDVDNDRTYTRTEGDRTYGRARTDQLTDRTDARTYEGTIYERNLGEKLLQLEDEKEWAMRMKMWERLDRDNPAGLADAKKKLNQNATDIVVIARKMDAAERAASDPEPKPDPNTVMKEAIRLATAAIKKASWYEKQQTVPTEKQIADFIPAVEEAQRGRINQAWQRGVKDAQLQYQINAMMWQRLSTENNVLTNVFRRVGIAGGETGATPAGETTTGTRNLTEPRTGAPAVPDLATAQQNARALVTGQPVPAPASPSGERMGGAGENRSAPAQPPALPPGATAQPPAPAAQPRPVSAQLNEPSQFPATSIMGLFQRAPQIRSAVANTAGAGASRLLEIPQRIDRAVGAIGKGVWMGDYSVPQQGGLSQLGGAAGNIAARFNDYTDARNKEAEDDILRNAPFSARAFQIRRERGLPQPQPVMQ